MGGFDTKFMRALQAGAAALALGFTVAGGANAQGGFDIPTGASPSPLFGALPFTQKLLRFEEFGTQPLPTTPTCTNCIALPTPTTCSGIPNGNQLDFFLKQRLWPMPTEAANTSTRNPWQSRISGCIAPLSTSSVEGRPPGEWFSHQRWNEFYPEVYFQSIQTGARRNTGTRNAYQRHGWTRGEFGPGGLYYVAGGSANTDVRLHPRMPIQSSQSVWTFDGTLPPKLLMARYGEPILFRHYNGLPVDPSANRGFGANTITTHEHNGHNPAESDGFTGAFFFPGQYYDYHWPMQLAGHDSMNTDAATDWAGAPDGAGGIRRIRGDWRETMSTHWFHDHMLDYTAQNVYKGNAAMMNYYSSVDRGNEGLNCNYSNPDNPNLCLPSGTALDWGNRDYDVNLVVADKAWDSTGQLFFNIFNLDGFLGDRVTVNWLYKPYMEVRARRYRFRILDGAVSRYFKIAVVNAATRQPIPFHLIANDGNIMEHAVAFPNPQSPSGLPTQGIAERFDIVIDFKQFSPGTRIQFVNLMEHKDGKGPNREVPLAEVMSNTYRGDPAVGPFLEMRVVAYSGVDRSMNPADYVEGGKTMIPLPAVTPQEIASAHVREFVFGRSNGTDDAPWTIKTDGGDGFGADVHRVSAALVNTGGWEIWDIKTGGGWAHPVHIHFEEGRILNRDGDAVPVWERWARKDVYRIGEGPDSSQEVQVLVRFREFAGTYVEHCHNTQHEDHAMLLRWDLRAPGQVMAIPTPVPTWEGVFYEPSFDLVADNGGGGGGGGSP